MPFLVRVLDRLADRDEQLQPLARRELVVVAVLGDRHAVDQLHDEVGPAAVGRAGVEHLGDVRVVHHRQGLPLGLEAGDDLRAVHARLDDLEGDLAADRLLLLGHVDDAHAAFADLLQQLVGADHGARSLGDRWQSGGRVLGCSLYLLGPVRIFEDTYGFVVCRQQRPHALKARVRRAGLFQELGRFRRLLQDDGK